MTSHMSDRTRRLQGAYGQLNCSGLSPVDSAVTTQYILYYTYCRLTLRRFGNPPHGGAVVGSSVLCVCAACCYHQLSIYAHVCKYLYYVMNEKCFVSKGAIFSIIYVYYYLLLVCREIVYWSKLTMMQYNLAQFKIRIITPLFFPVI